MKRMILLTVLSVVLLLGFFAPVSARDPLIGVIDTQAFMRESQSVQKQREEFFAVLKEKRALLHDRQEEVQKLEQELRSSSGSMPAAERSEKSDELAREAKEFQRLREDLAAETQKKNDEITRRILTELSGVVQEYRAKKKYTLVLERRFVAAFDDTIDITADIIKAYDGR
jgi:Skp family chaperone for outer membrane proteins